MERHERVRQQPGEPAGLRSRRWPLATMALNCLILLTARPSAANCKSTNTLNEEALAVDLLLRAHQPAGQHLEVSKSRIIAAHNRWMPMGQQQQQQQRLNSTADQLQAARRLPCVEGAHELLAASATNTQSRPTLSDGNNEDDDDDDEVAGAEREQEANVGELLASHESVSHESSLRPQTPVEADEGQQLGGATGDEDENSAPAYETPPDEAAERREQEAAEASEADAANRSALAEQQQAQREIILAQAQSEAKAIRDQQEALLQQQQMQQQILMQRHQNLLERDETRAIPAERHKSHDSNQYQQQQKRGQSRTTKHHYQQLESNRRDHQDKRTGSLPGHLDERLARLMDSTQGHQFTPLDNQFSDQLESGVVDRGMESASSSAQQLQQQRRDKNFNHAQREHRRVAMQTAARHHNQPQVNDELQQQQQQQQQQLTGGSSGEDELSGDYSVRRPLHSELPQVTVAPFNSQAASEVTLEPVGRGVDLQAAAQHHHYGAHYDSLLGQHHQKHKGHYYQFAESHKKGQFESGFKRGNKKFSISGHAAQHNGHAEGHVKWHGKKGKGTHYWDYKHKNKKPYGAGESYGGGHHHY